MRGVLIFIFILSGFYQVSGQTLIRDYKHDLMYFDQTQRLYLPYTYGSYDKHDAIHILITKQHWSGDGLVIKAPVESAFLINQKVVYTFKQDSLTVPISRTFEEYNSDSLFISVFSPGLIPENDLSMKSYIDDENITSDVKILTYFSRTKQNMDHKIIAVIFISVFLIIFKTANQKKFHEINRLDRLFSIRRKEEDSGLATTELATFVNITLISLTYSYIFLTLLNNSDIVNPAGLTAWLPRNNYMMWLALSGVFFMIFFIRMLIIQFFASMYQIDSFSSEHFLFQMRHFTVIAWVSLALVLIVDYSFLGVTSSNYDIVLFTVLFLLVLSEILLYLKAIAYTGYRKMHIISYLCGTEFVPLLIAVKVLLII
ncbi:DUF4271 domain-containing protein [Marinigracilibium pacificum]|uniref:DUF4271 domain-containing protein n=1 Tax=Marinigracilibium pacificum TaxID=2729599 RepID=A0A848ITS1_9BACT|nr:DUF4271 domain-containing protein [Marinigracilibium pacificum]NMM47146.1 DUF4271 domain-containing protein [Marinigracilibium pacificum]